MQRKAFERLVEEGFERLPQWVREKIKNVAVLVEDEPSNEVRKKEGLRDNETLLGYYQGIPLSERGEIYGIGMTMPDAITLFQIPIEEAAEELFVSRLNLDDQGSTLIKECALEIVAETIWHEFAHHFGMDEGEAREREQQRGIV